MTDHTAALSPREAYRLWAPGYTAETVVTALEDAAVRRETPRPGDHALLDVGCGTGRRLPPRGRATAVGVDLVYAMLAQRSRATRPLPALAAADARALPFRAAGFDLVWCRLMLGHLPDLAPAYSELARVATGGSTLVVSDFHPDAAAAGHTRTFRDPSGRVRTVEHYNHSADLHIDTAGRSGWRLVRRVDVCVGAEARPFYEQARALDRYQEQVGLALVIVLVYQR